MSAPVIPDLAEAAPAQSRTRSKRRFWIGGGVVLLVLLLLVLVGVVGVAVFHGQESRPVPKFASLAAQPDPSLQGTVAYTTGPDRCVRIVAAAGQPSRDVICLGPLRLDPAVAEKVGKEMTSPQLVWRADGRLEITGLLMQIGPQTKGTTPIYRAGWQKIVDVRTGTVSDVPASELPGEPDQGTHPTVSPSGQRITWTSNGMTGEVKVMLTDATGTRPLLSAHGPGEYGYALYSVFWAPNWQWIAADDGRILVVTPGTPPVTRVLVDGGGRATEFPTFAVTSENFLTGVK